MSALPGNRVSAGWLAAHLSDPDLVILDASWHLPTAGRNAKAEFAQKRIPGARFFDIDATSDKTSKLPHMLPAADDFARDAGALGIGNGSKVVCYDSVGLFSAARCWWTFKAFGHDAVAVLDGGLPAWEKAGGPLETDSAASPAPASFKAHLRAGMVKSMDQVAEGLRTGAFQVADARSGSRFRGEEQEPRPGVRPGHMPGARNVHYASLLGPDGSLKPQKDLEQAFTSSGIDLEKPVVTSCGSGVTAAILTLALTELGVKDHALYDGSWTEWGASTQPVAVR
ncbi:MAG: 3-mercaptopyruvate sulfurtransferase [Hyphomicrobiales bacterium]